MNRYTYAGYNDASVPLELITIRTAEELQRSFIGLALARMSDNDSTGACQVLQKMELVLSPGHRV